MSKIERIVAMLLFLAAAGMTVYQMNVNYKSKTVLVPASGGEYREAVTDEIKYLNPVLAQTSADKIASTLIFSGLVKIDTGGVYPDIAEKWEISPDGLIYTFHLRRDALFHDGANLSARDVAYTIETIKAYEQKSPFFDSWKDVKVSTTDDHTVIFELPRAYGPFIYNCEVGIIPSHISPDDLAKKYIGSGPYYFEKSKNSNRKTTEVELSRNDSFYGDKPLIPKVKLLFFDNVDKAKDAFTNNKVDAIFGTTLSRENITDHSYNSAKRLAWIFNLRLDKLKDKEFRRKLIVGESFAEPVKLRMVALDMPMQHAKAEEVKSKLSSQNVTLEVIYLNTVQLNDVLSSKEFETLLYGFDFGYDRDSYAFWHSSQLDKRNYAGYSDKDTDILLEDARMMSDSVERNKKYDEFFNKLGQEYLAAYFDPAKINFFVDNKIKSINSITGLEAESHLAGIADWYIKEKRVKK